MKKILLGLVATLGLAASCAASAAVVTATTGNMMLFTGGVNAQGFANLGQPSTVDLNTVFTRSLTGLGTSVVGNAKVTLTVMGEFDNTPEHIDQFAFEGVSFGPVFNLNAADDIWDNATWGDSAYTHSGNNYNFNTTTAISVSALLSQATMQSLLQDGAINMSFSFANDVNNYWNGTSFIAVTVEFEAAQVPEPSSIALLGLGLGLAGMTTLRKRKQD